MSTASTASSTAPEIDSLASWAQQFPRAERKARLLSLIQSGTLDDEEALVALYEWRHIWAREDQLAPEWAWSRWLVLAGRGWGKTKTGGEWCNEKARENLGPGALIARTNADIRKVLVEGPAGVLASSPPWFMPVYEPSNDRIIWPNGAYALVFSAQEPDALRGPQHAWAWGDELATWPYLIDTYGNLTMGLRLGVNPQLLVTTTPRPIPLLREMVADKASTHVTRGRTRDNADNLSAKALADLEKRYAGTRLGRQELEGEILDDVPGALWTRAMIEQARPIPGQRPPPLDAYERIVVGVDPSGSDGERGDFIGIVAAGKLKPQAAKEWNKDFGVLADLTCQERPEVWAQRVIEAFDASHADKIIAERNFGGDMVRAVIQAARAHAPVDLVSASRGKSARAEPISALYEQKRVMHAEPLIELEDELCLFTPTGFKGVDSPNRADALVWALTALAFGVLAAPSLEFLD